MNAFGFSLIASALDPLIFLPGIALGIFVAYAFRKLSLRLALSTLAIVLALGTAVGVFHSWLLEDPPLPFDLTRVDPNFKAWDAIKGSRYEEHYLRFVGVNNQPAADFVKRSIDQRESDCVVLVGRGPELLSRCRLFTQATGVAALWSVLTIAGMVTALLIGRRLIFAT